MAFATVDHLKAYLANFVSNDPDEPELADTELQKRLDIEASKIRNSWIRLYGIATIPSVPSIPPTVTDLILELLNVEVIAGDILANRSVIKYEQFKRQAEIYRKVADFRMRVFSTGQLSPAILSEINLSFLPTAVFCTNQESARETPGLTITDYTIPNNDTVSRLILRESAFVRAFAYKLGYELNIGSLTADQLNNYKQLILGLVSPHVQRIALSRQYSAAIDSIVLDNLDLGLKTLIAFSQGQFHFNFIL